MLQRLLGYVTGQIETEERGQFKSVIFSPPFATRVMLGLADVFMKIPVRCNRSSVQRDMVDCGDLRERTDAAPDTLLGDSSR